MPSSPVKSLKKTGLSESGGSCDLHSVSNAGHSSDVDAGKMKTDAEVHVDRKQTHDDKQEVDKKLSSSLGQDVLSSRSESGRNNEYYHSRQRDRRSLDHRSDCHRSNVDERGDICRLRGSSSDRKRDNENRSKCSHTEPRAVQTSNRDRGQWFRSHSPDRRLRTRDASREKQGKPSVQSRDPNPSLTRSFNERNRNNRDCRQDNEERTQRSRSRDRYQCSRYFDSRQSPIRNEFADCKIEGRSVFDKQRGTRYDFRQRDANSPRSEFPDRCPRRQPDRDRSDWRPRVETRRDRTERTSFDYRDDEYVRRNRPENRSSDDLRYTRRDYPDRTDRVDIRSVREPNCGHGDGKWCDNNLRHPSDQSLPPKLNTESVESFTKMHTRRGVDESSISSSRRSRSRPRRTNTSESKELQGLAGREVRASSANDQDFKDINVSNQRSQSRSFSRLSRSPSPHIEHKTNRSRSCEKSRDSFERHDRQQSDSGYRAYRRNSPRRSRSPRPSRLNLHKNESVGNETEFTKAKQADCQDFEKDRLSGRLSVKLPASSSVPATFTYPLSSSLSWPSSQTDSFYCLNSEPAQSGIPPEACGLVMKSGWPTDATLRITSDVSSTSHLQVSPIQATPVNRLVDPRLASSPFAKALAPIAQQNLPSDGIFRVPAAPVSAPHLSAAVATTTNIFDDSPLLNDPSLSSPVAICEATSGSAAFGTSSSGSLPLDVSEYTDMVQSLDSVELKKMLDAVTMVKTTLEKTVLFVDENECVEIDKQHKAAQMEAVAEEVKAALKPYFVRNEIDKEEYKDIMRRAVPKITSSKHSAIDKKKIRTFVTDYVAKVKAAQKRVMVAKIHMLQQQQQQSSETSNVQS